MTSTPTDAVPGSPAKRQPKAPMQLVLLRAPTQGGEVPDVVGLTTTQAGKALSKLHLEMNVGASTDSPTTRVISQVPTAGARGEVGSVVAVRASNG